MLSTRYWFVPLALLPAACTPPRPATGTHLPAMPSLACIDNALLNAPGVTDVVRKTASGFAFDLYPHFGPSRDREYYWSYRVDGRPTQIAIKRDHYAVRYHSDYVDNPDSTPSEPLAISASRLAEVDARVRAECGLPPPSEPEPSRWSRS